MIIPYIGITLISLILIVQGTCIFFITLYSGIIFWKENEYKAAKYLIIGGILISLIYFIPGLINFSFKDIAGWCITVITVCFIILIILPVKSINPPEDAIPVGKYDERNTMFSRMELKINSENYIKYYNDNPDKKKPDDKFRKLPGILSTDSKEWDPLLYASAKASSFVCENLRPLVDNPDLGEKTKIPINEITTYLKKWIKHLGAHSVGITILKKYHLYKTAGRREMYNKPVHINHKYAIAFSMELDIESIKASPKAPIIMESSKAYLQIGTIAAQVGDFIRQAGYSARAHIDATYQIICPFVARDAGLGEIGRIGLLITPDLGPRVRLAVVTTDLPLITDKRKYDSSVIEFCKNCKKCAYSCPAQAISHNSREKINGSLHWPVNHEKCFTHWCRIGTDCGRCLAVCPYSRKLNKIRKVTRLLLRKSYIFRKLAPKLDNLLYGKIPGSLKYKKELEHNDEYLK